MTTTTFLGGMLLTAPFAAAVATGAAIGVTTIVISDVLGAVAHLKH
ncbi:MAG: hypothetical protein AB7O74_01860 [Candidatus Nanopelagicales bacterium]